MGFAKLPGTRRWQPARRLQEIQAQYGKDAVTVLEGASLISEKTYLLGKLARVALGTRHIDYNGRLCMISGRYGLQTRTRSGSESESVAGHSRGAGGDLSRARTWLSGFPITTDLWRMRDNGERLIVIDPRRTPICRNADLYLPVRPGTDTALFSCLLHVILREGLTNREFIAQHTTGFEQVEEYVKGWDPRRTAEVTEVRPDLIEQAAR